MDYAGSCNERAMCCAHGLLKSTHGKYLMRLKCTYFVLM